MKKRLIAAGIAAVILAGALTGCEKRQIVPVSPSDGGRISASNATVARFCAEYTRGASEKIKDYTDMYYPAGIDIAWRFDCDELPLYSFVTVSTRSDLGEGEKYVTAGTSVHVDDVPVNTDLYWQVEAVYADHTVLSGIFRLRTAEEPRTYEIPKVSNTRDLGGYTAAGGKKVAQGMIIRGANVDGANAETRRAMLDELGIKTDLDLRAPGEGTAGGGSSPLGKDVNYVNISAPLYTGLRDEEKQAAFAEEIRVFTDEANYPIYFHCAIGRDRTGTLALVLLGLLGVAEETIWRDYEMSFLSQSGSADKVTAELMFGSNFGPTVDYLKSFGGRTFADNVERFLLSIGITGDEIKTIRKILLR